jgi:hypothetical protein
MHHSSLHLSLGGDLGKSVHGTEAIQQRALLEITCARRGQSRGTAVAGPRTRYAGAVTDIEKR